MTFGGGGWTTAAAVGTEPWDWSRLTVGEIGGNVFADLVVWHRVLRI